MSFPQITDAQQLLLALVCGSRIDPLDSWMQWRRQTDWAHTPTDSITFELLPLVSQQLNSTGKEFPDQARLQGVFRRRWVEQEMKNRNTAGFLEAMSVKTIPFLLLGGAAYAALVYPEGQKRFYPVLEVLVRPADLTICVDLLMDQGWRSQTSTPIAQTGILSGQPITFTHPSTAVVRIQPHFFVENQQSASDQSIWERSVTVLQGETEVRFPSVTDLLLDSCLQGWSLRSQYSMLWAADIHTLLVNKADEISWEYFLQEAKRRKISLRVGNSAAYLKSNFDMGFPDLIVKDLQQGPFASFELPEEKYLHVQSSWIPVSLCKTYYLYLRHSGKPDGFDDWMNVGRLWLRSIQAPGGWQLLRWVVKKLFQKSKIMLRSN